MPILGLEFDDRTLAMKDLFNTLKDKTPSILKMIQENCKGFNSKSFITENQ